MGLRVGRQTPGLHTKRTLKVLRAGWRHRGAPELYLRLSRFSRDFRKSYSLKRHYR